MLAFATLSLSKTDQSKSAQTIDHLAPNAPFNIDGFSAHSAIKNSVVQVARVSETSLRSTESRAAEDSVSIKGAINVSAF